MDTTAFRRLQREGALIRALQGALGGGILPVGCGLLALLFSPVLGRGLCHLSAWLIGAIVVLACCWGIRPFWTGLVWLAVGSLTWAAVYWIGRVYWRWDIDESVLAAAVGGAVIAFPGTVWAVAVHSGESCAPIHQDPLGRDRWLLVLLQLSGWLLCLFGDTRLGILAAALAGALWGGLGGAIGGGMLGAFTGELGMRTFHAAVGGVVAGATLAALGGAFGLARVYRTFSREPAQEEALAPKEVG